MKDNKVFIVRCESYDNAPEKIDGLISMMGGMGQFVRRDEKITLKANLLGAFQPERAVSTHPSVVAAVGALVKKEGAVPLIADSPGSGYRYNEATLKKLYTACGMFDAAKQAGIDVNMDTGFDEVSFPEGKLIKHLEVIKPITQADGVINMCKLKSHLFMHMTGAVKNNFGIIPGLSKVGFHSKLHDKERFADMLLDLALYVSPRLSIMDAVVGMEGDGPGASGTPRHIGLLLASTNPVALDVVASEIIGLPHRQNPVLMAAEQRGIMPNRIEDIVIVGPELTSLKIRDFRLPSTITSGSGLSKGGGALQESLNKALFTKTPYIIRDKCVGCGVCRDACPLKAIEITGEKRKIAKINGKICIRCYCCHELCPQKAVSIRKSLLSKLLDLK